MNHNLIYDVGMHNGDDTAYYLSQGFDVIAIEADPSLVKNAQLRFSDEIMTNRLNIVAAGVSDNEGTVDFWICDDNTEWNSFSKEISSREGGKCHMIQIETIDFKSILEKYGIPYFMKVDIEGNDILCLKGIDKDEKPKFISTECECVDDQGHTGQSKDGLHALSILFELGYNKFKLINQRTFYSYKKKPDLVGKFIYLAHRIFYNPFMRSLPGAVTIAQKLTTRGRLESKINYIFPMGGSGPWGNDTYGGWVCFDEAKSIYNEQKKIFENGPGKTRPYAFWCDWHATY